MKRRMKRQDNAYDLIANAGGIPEIDFPDGSVALRVSIRLHVSYRPTKESRSYYTENLYTSHRHTDKY